MARTIRQCAHPLCENEEMLGGSGYCIGHLHNAEPFKDETAHECAVKNCHAPRALNSMLCLAHVRFVNTWDGSVGRGLCAAENCNAPREEDSIFCPAHRYFFSQQESVSENTEERRCAYCDLALGNAGIDSDDQSFCNNGCLAQFKAIAREKRCDYCDEVWTGKWIAVGDSKCCSLHCAHELEIMHADALKGTPNLQDLEPFKDNTNIRPNYYRTLLSNGTEVECFDLIDALGLDFYLGNALKYLWRAGKKEGAPKLEDLRKIRTYIEQALEKSMESE